MKLVLCLILGLTMLAATSAMAVYYTEQYEMDGPMDVAANTAWGNAGTLASGYNGGTYGNDGMEFSGGIMTFLDDAQSSGNQGIWSDQIMIGSSEFICDFSIKVLQDQSPAWGSKAKSMSFWSTQGRGLQIDRGRATFVNGTNNVGTAGSWAFSEWTTARVTISGSANTANLYVWEDGWTNIASTSMGGSGNSYGPPINWALGSHSGSGTTLCNFEMDYFRVYSGSSNVADEFDLKPPVPEPSSVLALASGLIGMAGFAIRRRRA